MAGRLVPSAQDATASVLSALQGPQDMPIRNTPFCEKFVSNVAEFRGKELVMRLMMHPEPEVQKQALLCVQKIMLAKDKLEYLNAN